MSESTAATNAAETLDGAATDGAPAPEQKPSETLGQAVTDGEFTYSTSTFTPATATLDELRGLAYQAAQLAEIARKELAGEPRTEDEYWTIFGFGRYLVGLLATLSSDPMNPSPVALVTDVASNPSAKIVLQEAVGRVDYVYVVVPASTGGWQLVRGGVFSLYEWIGDINQRMTDADKAKLLLGYLADHPKTETPKL